MATVRFNRPAPQPPVEDRARLATARARVLALLQQRGTRGATNVELCAPDVGGQEGTRRVRELRGAGYPIHHLKIRGGIVRYWMTTAQYKSPESL